MYPKVPLLDAPEINLPDFKLSNLILNQNNLNKV